MFLDTGTDNLATKWEAWYTYNQSAILSILSKWYKKEGMYGYSCKQYLLQQYYFAFYYTYLIYKELSYGVNTSYSYYNEKYDIDNIAKNLTCNDINLSYLINTVFAITFTDEESVREFTILQDEECIGFTCD